jgi:hypothetical protein
MNTYSQETDFWHTFCKVNSQMIDSLFFINFLLFSTLKLSSDSFLFLDTY